MRVPHICRKYIWSNFRIRIGFPCLSKPVPHLSKLPQTMFPYLSKEHPDLSKPFPPLSKALPVSVEDFPVSVETGFCISLVYRLLRCYALSYILLSVVFLSVVIFFVCSIIDSFKNQTSKDGLSLFSTNRGVSLLFCH